MRCVVPFDSKWNVVVEKGTFSAPLEVKASCKITNPNGLVRSSIAVDAPPEIRAFALGKEVEEDTERHASEMSLAARSEG